MVIIVVIVIVIVVIVVIIVVVVAHKLPKTLADSLRLAYKNLSRSATYTLNLPYTSDLQIDTISVDDASGTDGAMKAAHTAVGGCISCILRVD